jgi:hypothetical protein
MRVIIPIDTLMVSSNIAEDEGPTWSATTTYSKGQKAIVDHEVYESLIDSNLNKNPPDNLKAADGQTTAAWKTLGTSNHWKMFNRRVSSPSERDEEIRVTIGAAKTDAVCMFGVDASEIQIIRTDENGVQLMDDTISLLLDSCSSWLQYFFGDPEYIQEKVVPIPPAFTGNVEVMFRKPGGTAKCGQLVVGRSVYIGMAMNGANTGIVDYSSKIRAEDGGLEFKEGEYADRMTIDVKVAAGAYDQVKRVLTRLRSQPAVYQADELPDVEALLLYGTASRFDQGIVEYNNYKLALTLEGLI